RPGVRSRLDPDRLKASGVATADVKDRAVANHPAAVVQGGSAARGGEAEDLGVGLADADLVGDGPSVDQLTQPGVQDLRGPVVGHSVGHDADTPPSGTELSDTVEILSTAGSQLGHAPTVLSPQ